MNYDRLIATLDRLPAEKKAEVVDFVDYLAQRFGQPPPSIVTEWSEGEFSSFAMTQAMRGIEDEPVLYTEADLKERWR